MGPDTRVQDLLGIELPILLAPMAGAVSSELAIAVAEAGGTGLSSLRDAEHRSGTSLAPESMELGEVSLPLPTIITRDGVARVVSIPLVAAERQALEASADTLKQYIAALKTSDGRHQTPPSFNGSHRDAFPDHLRPGTRSHRG
jgi:NAD(P)H-dependent flavin oxidoreductase YrpB (nitropropane dioxygenase family)